MSVERYLKWLPPMLWDYREYRLLAETEDKILEEEHREAERITHAQWLMTAEEKDLLRFARIMGISAAGKSAEGLRRELLAGWNGKAPYTFRTLLDWLDDSCGENTYHAEADHRGCRLRILLELSQKEKKDFLERSLRKMIPANMVLEVILHTNLHGELKVLTHGEIKRRKWTHGQLPFAEFVSD